MAVLSRRVLVMSISSLDVPVDSGRQAAVIKRQQVGIRHAEHGMANGFDRARQYKNPRIFNRTKSSYEIKIEWYSPPAAFTTVANV